MRKRKNQVRRLRKETLRIQREREAEELFSKRIENELTFEALKRAENREVRYVV